MDSNEEVNLTHQIQMLEKRFEKLKMFRATIDEDLRRKKALNERLATLRRRTL